MLDHELIDFVNKLLYASDVHNGIVGVDMKGSMFGKSSISHIV